MATGGGSDTVPHVARRRQTPGTPRDFVAAGDYPDAELAADAPVAAVYAQRIAVRLRDALAGGNRTAVADRADVSRTALHDIVTGRTFPDVVTLAKLEEVLGVRLWPDPPRRRGSAAGRDS